MTNLTLIHLSGNELTGCVPAGLQDVEDNDLGQLGLSICLPEDPVVARYDDSGNGKIELSEVETAIGGYFGQGPDAPSLAEIEKLIAFYFS